MLPQTRQPNDKDHAAWNRVPDEAREKLRRAVARLNRDGKAVTVGGVQVRAETSRARATLARRLYKAGVLPDPGTADGGVGAWSRRAESGGVGADAGEPDGAPRVKGETELRLEFAEAVLAATSDEERARLQHRLAHLIALGVYGHQEANAIRQSLNTATAHNREARNAPGDEARASRVYAGPDSYGLVRAFDGIVSDERRARILRLVADEFQADLAEHPPIDTSATHAEPAGATA